jgi:hypothetical protein
VSRFIAVVLFALAAAPPLRAQEIEEPTPFPPPDKPAPPAGAPLLTAPWTPPLPARTVSPIHPTHSQAMFAGDPTLREVFTTSESFGHHAVWGGAEYMMAWFRKAPLAVPLAVATTTAPGPGANVLGLDPNARVILGPDQVEQNLRSGGRAWLGFWFGADATLGLEVVGLWLESPSERMGVQSDAFGVPLLSRPIVMPDGVPGVYDISYPGAVRGSFFVQNHQLLRGLEANVVGFAGGDHSGVFEFLAGARFIDFQEQLNLQYAVTNLVAMPAFGGDMLVPGVTVGAVDSYRATNQFYGGQIGGRLEGNFGRLSLAFTGKVALGVNDMTLHVDGLTVRSDSAATYPAGVLANVANVGRYHESHFAVVPEGNFSVGWWFTPRLRVKVGYNVLYISDVVRPGSHVSNAVNPAAVPVDQIFGSALVPRTPPQFVRSDFWAEGIMFGIDFRY